MKKHILIMFAAVLMAAGVGVGTAEAAPENQYLTILDKSTSKIVLEGVIPYTGGTLQLLMKKGADSDYSIVHEVQTSSYYATDGRMPYVHTVENLEPNTTYDFLLKKSYQGNNEDSVVKTTTGTLLQAPVFRNFSKKYAEPGETVYLNGDNLNPTPDYITSDYIMLQLDGQCTLSTSSDTCIIGTTEKEDGNKVKFEVPKNAKLRSGKVTLKKGYYEWPQAEGKSSSKTVIKELYSVESLEDFHVICAGCMERMIESKYQDDEYRHLVNSLDYRYGLGQAGRTTISKEQSAAFAFRNRMNKRKNVSFEFDIDALWFLNLFQSSYYGGYTDEDIENEILAGPGVVHTAIPKSVWKETVQYRQTTEKAIQHKN